MKIKLKIKQVFDVKYLQVSAKVRYWEDANVNQQEDTEGILIPCRNNDLWEPLINVDSGQIENWEKGKSAKIHYKVCDAGVYSLLDENKNIIKSIKGYVINDLQINENGYGDYIIISINKEGFIKDFNNPELKEFK